MSTAFSILRFTPDPEEVEPANVALVLWNGVARIVYDDSFPRLSCLAPWVDKDSLCFLLEDLQKEIASADPRTAADALGSVQFSLSATKQVADLGRGDTDRLLLDRYLRTSRGRREKTSRTQRIVESRLDRFLAEMKVSSVDLMKGVSPKRFLSPEALARVGGNGFRVSRVIKSSRHLVLLDAVPLDLRPVRRVEARAQRIASAYYRLGKSKADIARIDGRDLTRTTILFGMSVRVDAAVSGKLDFARHMLQEESDVVVDADAPEPSFQERLHEATEGLF
jgi:hypothetical protein